ncbi:MAG: HAMP domain-containing histidine kinase [Clostridia bacterium]|nr:HAMP domain-containing histidine kinase [Clostridia bacterium]
MLKSIRSKLILLFGIILSVTLLLQMLLNLFYAEQYYIHQKSKQINKVYQMLKSQYTDDSEQLYTLLKPAEEASNIRVMIFSDERKMIYLTALDRQFGSHTPPAPAPGRFRPDFRTYLEDAEAVLQKSPMSEEENLVLCGRLNTEYGNRYIMLETPVASIQTTVEITNRFSLTVALLALGIGVLFVWIFSNNLTKPIKKIDKIARNVANLDFSMRADAIKGQDEIAHLSENINLMSERWSDMIQKLKVANEELEQYNRYKTQIDTMRKEFVAHVSHELKTPISLLMGYAEMLKNDVEGIDKSFDCDVIMDESEKMNRLVSNLLEVSRLENGISQLTKETVNLNELLDWILEKQKISLEEKNLQVRKQGTTCVSCCDKLKIEQVITNYITNAIRHAREDSALEMNLFREDEGIVFSVYNEGDSIEDKDIKKIWNSFYKADESRTDRTSTGLGLYIVKTIVIAHGGEVGVCNRDNGVEFWFRIP